MTTQTVLQSTPDAASAHRESQIRQTIDQLSYLPTAMAVALRFVELGKSPDAEPKEYAQVISSDASLSSKLLALSNSSWFGVRQKITNVPMAVNLLGLANVRALSVSYCMTGLHHDLRLDDKAAHTYWEAALCKGVAAKVYLRRAGVDLEDEGLLAGIFQDIALPIMHAVADEQVMTGLRDHDGTLGDQLKRERAQFRMDHTEIGRLVAHKLELPEMYVDAIAFHHDRECLDKFLETDALADAVYVASLFPHLHDAWRSDDCGRLDAVLEELRERGGGSCEEFLDAVQTEFNSLYAFFASGNEPELRLEAMRTDASREIADATTHMVGQMSYMLGQNAALGREMMVLAESRDKFEEKAARDGLTRLLNRDGFKNESEKLFATLSRYQSPLAIGFFDIDRFKNLNDFHGHVFGDFCLQELAHRIGSVLPSGAILARLGGDEFVLMLGDRSAEQATQLMTRIVDAVSQDPFVKGKLQQPVTISAGLAWTSQIDATTDVSTIMAAADHAMYAAKGAGGNRFEFETVEPAP